MFAAGIFTLGSSSTNLLQAKIPLPKGFVGSPVVVANALQKAGAGPGAFPDTFAVTITENDESQFAVNVFRVDNAGATPPGWSQNLRLSWMASDPT